MRWAVLWVIFLLALAPAIGAPAMAQQCEDCKIIKKGLREATPGATAPVAAPTQAEPAAALSPAAPVVRLVLFWAEGCGHCHEVLDGVLPALQQRYGLQLEVRLVEVATMDDIAGFFDAAEARGFERGRASVPFLVIGDRALMGVEQISAELPGLVEASLASGGTGWPSLARERAGPTSPLAGDACGFTAPCEDDSDAGVSTRVAVLATGAAPVMGTPAIAVGLAAVIGVGLASLVLLRARLRRAHGGEQLNAEREDIQGDDDAI